MSEIGRGLPLLSGPPPSPHTAETDKSCRRCNKEFAFLIVRHRKCNHCGHTFCYNCTDYQALMPRENGYDAMNVCGFCIEYLTITAAGRGQLKTIPLSKLRNYINAYSIETVDRIVEKDDLIDAIIKARGPNGCLPPGNEAYYRKHSIPNKSSSSRSRGFFATSRPGQNTNHQAPPPKVPPRPSPPEFARPDLQPDMPQPPQPPQPTSPWPSYPNAPRPGESSDQHQQQQRQYAPPPFPPPSQPPRPSAPWNQHFQPPPPTPPHPHPPFGYAAPPPPQPQTPPFTPGYGRHPPNYTPGPPPPPPPQSTRPPAQPTSQPIPIPSPPPPPPSTRPRAPSTAPPPSLDQLLGMPPDSIRTLSISVLKSILFTNHVNVANILEKGDLVSKVVALVEDEKRERERMRLVGEMEEMERVQRELEREGVDVSSTTRDGAGSSQQSERAPSFEEEHPSDPITDDGQTESNPGSQRPNTNGAKLPPASNISMSAMERNGLCVVCQDEEANIAIVDCGHLAMCRSCSDLVMSSSKECPLCRTRIVTEARLLRIFKT